MLLSVEMLYIKETGGSFIFNHSVLDPWGLFTMGMRKGKTDKLETTKLQINTAVLGFISAKTLGT